jgi:hypothetical protein
VHRHKATNLPALENPLATNNFLMRDPSRAIYLDSITIYFYDTGTLSVSAFLGECPFSEPSYWPWRSEMRANVLDCNGNITSDAKL